MKPVVFNKYLVICQEVEHTIHPKPEFTPDGKQIVQEPIVLTKLEPRVIIVRNRSKYMPHQGTKERIRRGKTHITQ